MGTVACQFFYGDPIKADIQIDTGYWTHAWRIKAFAEGINLKLVTVEQRQRCRSALLPLYFSEIALGGGAVIRAPCGITFLAP